MLTLTREVRFAVPFAPSPGGSGKVHNGFAGWPVLDGAGIWLRLEVTVSGELDRDSQYLVDIKAVDTAVRERAVPFLGQRLWAWGPGLMVELAELLGQAFAPAKLERLVLHLTPFQSWDVLTKELPMVRISHHFEFSAAHRLHNPRLSDEENRTLFGKCNNALGHGHNYQVQVTVRPASAEGFSLADMERVVDEAVIKPFDHKHLNLEVEDFRETLASVENIAAAAFRRLKPVLPEVVSVTVWETTKTWAEYSE